MKLVTKAVQSVCHDILLKEITKVSVELLKVWDIHYNIETYLIHLYSLIWLQKSEL